MTVVPAQAAELANDTSDDQEVDSQQEDSKSESKSDLTGFDANELLLTIVSDPDVSKVLEAKRNKKSIKIVEEEPEPDPIDDVIVDTGDEDFDANIKKIVGLIDKKMEQSLAPIRESVEGLQGIADQFTSQAVEAQIEAVAKKHPDLSTYCKAMAALAAKSPGLSVEELLIISKSRAGKLTLDDPSTHSERPTPTPRRLVSQDRKEPARRGRRGFSEIVADALDKRFG